MAMTPLEFATHLPALTSWITQTLQASAPHAKPVAERGFKRLSGYFPPDLLASTKFVIVDKIPIPPLGQIGLPQFSDWENGDYDGVTYLDTFFVKRGRDCEPLFLHELVHVIQWRELGEEQFIGAYAAGLERFAYKASPLEAMAYRAQEIFESSPYTFDVERFVQAALRAT